MNLAAGVEVGAGAGPAIATSSSMAIGVATGTTGSTPAETFRANWQTMFEALGGSTNEDAGEEATNVLPAKLSLGTSSKIEAPLTPLPSNALTSAAEGHSLKQTAELTVSLNAALQLMSSSQTVAAAIDHTATTEGTASGKSTKGTAESQEKKDKTENVSSVSTAIDPLGLIGQISLQAPSVGLSKPVDRSLGSGGSRISSPTHVDTTTTEAAGAISKQGAISEDSSGMAVLRESDGQASGAGLDAGIGAAGQQAGSPADLAAVSADKLGAVDDQTGTVAAVGATGASLAALEAKGSLRSRQAVLATEAPSDQRGAERAAHVNEAVASSHKSSTSEDASVTTVASPEMTAAPVRDASGLVGVSDRQTPVLNPSHSVVAGTSGASDRDTFSALDADSGAPTTSWIHAGAHSAEAGYLDPALGWVGVRAEVSGGGVHAAVMPGSDAAAQALGGQLAGLNSYLAEHHGQSATVTLDAPQNGTAGSSYGQGMSQGATDGGGGQQQGSNQTGQQPTNASEVLSVGMAASRQQGSVSGNSGMAHRPGVVMGMGSIHISVMA